MQEALGLLARAVTWPNAPAADRVAAAWTRGEVAAAIDDWVSATEGFATAVELLPRVVWRAAAREDKEDRLVRYGEVGVDAAASWVAAGRAEEAVTWLEQSRAVLWGQALDLQADRQIENLRGRDRRLAGAFERVVAELRALDTRAVASASGADVHEGRPDAGAGAVAGA